jgi:apolipoprotein N-acyltransferase
VARTGLLRRENLVGTERLLETTTPYAQLGDWPGPLATGLVLLALSRRRRT